MSKATLGPDQVTPRLDQCTPGPDQATLGRDRSTPSHTGTRPGHMMGASPTRRLLALLSLKRWRCAVVAAVMVASVLGEVAVPYFMGRVTDWVASEDEVAAAWPTALLGLGSAVTEFTCDGTYVGTLSRALGCLQRRVFTAVLRDITSLRVTGTGAVTAWVMGDVEATHAAVAEALSLLLWYLAWGVCLLVTMVWLSPHLASVTLLSLPVLLLLPRGVSKIQQGLSRRVQEALVGASKVAVETMPVPVLLCYYPNMTKAVGSSEKIFEILGQEEQVTLTGTLAPDVLRGHLQLEDVSFSYPEHQEPILKSVSLEPCPREVLAVVAPPGAGKSTLVSLVLRLLPPGAGQVLLDGHPLHADQHPYLRCQVAAVPQEPVLFSRSLHANITYGSGCWSRAQVTVAARRAGAHAFITRLPWGFDTEVGELGGQLSRGQRQRVAIARALVRDPSVLILDEPTSALGIESQLQAEQEIFGASGAGRAVLLVTGQVALAMRAQRVAVLEGGRLHEHIVHVEE
ncbi:LOW QUALITY PROTEIN: antigen peptide transporter 1-like [Phoenicopterus ruber ruber]